MNRKIKSHIRKQALINLMMSIGPQLNATHLSARANAVIGQVDCASTVWLSRRLKIE